MSAKPKRDTQGSRANDAGAAFEDQMRAALERKGYRELIDAEKRDVRGGTSLRELDGLWYAQQLNAFANIYEAKFKADFLFNANGSIYVVEMKWQATQGSTDEKFPFSVASLKKAAGEHGLVAVLVLAGGGARPSSVRWCRAQQDASLIVLAPGDELMKWVNSDFGTKTKRPKHDLLG